MLQLLLPSAVTASSCYCLQLLLPFKRDKQARPAVLWDTPLCIAPTQQPRVSPLVAEASGAVDHISEPLRQLCGAQVAGACLAGVVCGVGCARFRRKREVNPRTGCVCLVSGLFRHHHTHKPPRVCNATTSVNNELPQEDGKEEGAKG